MYTPPKEGYFFMQRITDKLQLKREILENSPDIYEFLVVKAISFSENIHMNDVRFSGEPFIIHSLNVARNCALMELDTNSIIVAILHQTLSKRFRSEDEIKDIYIQIENIFGTDVVELLNKVIQINDATKMHRKTDFNVLKKYMFSGVKDIRPTLIKLADILDDAQTLDFIPEDKKAGFVDKIFNVYGPLAEYLNLGEVKRIIEENAFRISQAEEYFRIKQLLIDERIDQNLKDNYLNYISKKLKIQKYSPKILGRVKGPYSIYNKLHKYEKEGKGKALSNIRDLIAFTIIVKNETDCYEICHQLQNICQNDPDEFDDYILLPKPNGYRALHLSLKVHEISNLWIEVQILTSEMYYTNTYGPASHIAYKAALKRFTQATSQFNWVENIHKEIEKHINLRETNRSIPISGDVFKNQIFVQTPNGKIIELEIGATVIDFAYKIHTEIGNSAVSGRVDDKPVKLSHILNTGDIVEVVTRKGKSKPDIQWLEFAVSNSTRRTIRENLD